MRINGHDITTYTWEVDVDSRVSVNGEWVHIDDVEEMVHSGRFFIPENFDEFKESFKDGIDSLSVADKESLIEILKENMR